MNIQTPKGWRKGQTIFNFLWWLKGQGYHTELGTEGRMADPFHISDEVLEALFTAFLKEHI